MGMLKDKNGKDLSEAEEIKKRWQEYTRELYKKELHEPENHNGVITHLEPDTLECKVKWALGSITTNKASGGDGILVELFQILKNDAMKVLHSICQQIWRTKWLEKVTFHSNPIEGKSILCSNYHTIALISHMPARLCSKSSKLGFSSTGTKNFQMYKLDLEKAEEPEIKLPT